MSELPEIPALQHLAKARPKRPKKHAATRGIAKVVTKLNTIKDQQNILLRSRMRMKNEDEFMDETTVD